MADPRLTDPAETVNERLQDRAIRHGVYLARLQTQEAREVLRFIDRDIIPDLEDQISRRMARSEEHTSELQSLMRISYAVFCLKKKKITTRQSNTTTH